MIEQVLPVVAAAVVAVVDIVADYSFYQQGRHAEQDLVPVVELVEAVLVGWFVDLFFQFLLFVSLFQEFSFFTCDL